MKYKALKMHVTDEKIEPQVAHSTQPVQATSWFYLHAFHALCAEFADVDSFFVRRGLVRKASHAGQKHTKEIYGNWAKPIRRICPGVLREGQREGDSRGAYKTILLRHTNLLNLTLLLKRWTKGNFAQSKCQCSFLVFPLQRR